MKERIYKNDAYWGVCPTCGDSDGCINIGRDHWFVCHEHRVRWCVGSNLFSAWREENEDQWRGSWERIGPYAAIGEQSSQHPRARAELWACRIQADRAGLQMTRVYGGSLLRVLGVRLRLAFRLALDRVLTAWNAKGRPFCASRGQRGAALHVSQGDSQ